MARASERFQTESQLRRTRREFTLVKRERRSEDGWQIRFANGDINWISDLQFRHCHKLASTTGVGE